MRYSVIIAVGLASALSAQTVTASDVASHATRISLQIPTVCELALRRGEGTTNGTLYLGTLVQYCNAPGGFSVEVSYPAGTLVGTSLRVGSAEIILDGSGNALVGGANGPDIIEQEIFAQPAQGGLDANSLSFSITPR